MTTRNTVTVTGQEAIGYLVGHTFTRKRDCKIIEHDTGIDVDNAGRFYEHESKSSYKQLMWCALVFMPKDGNLDEMFSADVELNARNGAMTGLLRQFHIHTDRDDSESRGSHYEFVWREGSVSYWDNELSTAPAIYCKVCGDLVYRIPGGGWRHGSMPAAAHHVQPR